MDELTLEALAIMAQQGDKQSLSELVIRVWPFVYRTAYRSCRNRSLVDDMAQEAFIYLIEKIVPRYDPATENAFLTFFGRNLSLWMLTQVSRDRLVYVPKKDERNSKRIAELKRQRSTSISIFDSESKAHSIPCKSQTPLNILIERETIVNREQKCVEILSSLDQREKQMVMAKMSGEPYRRICKSHGVSKSRIEQIVRSSLRKLITMTRKSRRIATRYNCEAEHKPLFAIAADMFPCTKLSTILP